MAASDTSHDRPRLAERLTRSLALARFTDARAQIAGVDRILGRV